MGERCGVYDCGEFDDGVWGSGVYDLGGGSEEGLGFDLCGVDGVAFGDVFALLSDDRALTTPLLSFFFSPSVSVFICIIYNRRTDVQYGLYSR